MPPIFPSLPIVTPDPPRKTQAEKYGGLYYVGIAGLLTLILLLGWFAYGVWSMWDVWDAIYRLHDAKRPEAERVEAAFFLARDPRLNQRQRYEMVERNRGLPPLARYLLAESLTAEAAGADPRAYALAVARSRGWPDWLRLLLIRPLAYRAAAGLEVPAEPLDELVRLPDPIIPLWAAYARAAAGDDGSARLLREAGRRREQAIVLGNALRSEMAERARLLDRATSRIRTDHPGAAEVWAGWVEREGRLIRGPAPELQQPAGRPAAPAP